LHLLTFFYDNIWMNLLVYQRGYFIIILDRFYILNQQFFNWNLKLIIIDYNRISLSYCNILKIFQLNIFPFCFNDSRVFLFSSGLTMSNSWQWPPKPIIRINYSSDPYAWLGNVRSKQSTTNFFQIILYDRHRRRKNLFRNTAISGQIR
jgi:hypothetical protein